MYEKESKFEIKSLISGKVLFSLKCGSIKVCVEAAVENRTDLMGADLMGADLRGVYLMGADLMGKIKITRTPLQILGLRWDIIVFDSHMKIGCEFHSISEWDCFDDETISNMSDYALEFWKKSKVFIMEFCRANGRG